MVHQVKKIKRLYRAKLQDFGEIVVHPWKDSS